jgi:hypothetical protein
MSARHLLVVVVLALLGAGGCGGGQAPQRGTPAPRHARGTPDAQPSTVTPAPPRAAWTRDTVLRRIAGRRISASGRKVRIDPGTVVCGGVGAPATRRRGRPAWARFRCLQPTFPPGSVAGPDAVFVVEPTGPRTYTITGARLTHY